MSSPIVSMTGAQFRALPFDELSRLQNAHPPINSDASNPNPEYQARQRLAAAWQVRNAEINRAKEDR